jgi:hypothetical protein
MIISRGVSTPLAYLSGVPVEDLGEHWLQEYSDYLDLMEELVDPANAPPVDNFAVLRLVPSMFAEWKRKVPGAKKALLSVFGAMMSESKKHVHSSFPSLIPELLRQTSSDPSAAPAGLGSEQEIKFMMGGMLYVSPVPCLCRVSYNASLFRLPLLLPSSTTPTSRPSA